MSARQHESPMTTIRQLTADDLVALKSFLEARRASSMFLLSNLAASGIVEGDQPFEGTYVADFDGEQIIGVAAHYWNGNLMPQTDANAAVLARAALAASGRALKGLVGPQAQCDAVNAAFNLDESKFQLLERERLYRVTRDALVVPKAGAQVRRAQASDRGALIDFYREYHIEALNDPPAAALADAMRDVDRRAASGTQWVLDQRSAADNSDGLVSACVFNATVAPTVQIGGVYTPPHLRGRGLARACVAGALATAFSEGFAEAILFTGERNVAAWKAYEAIGFRTIGDYCIALLREPFTL